MNARFVRLLVVCLSFVSALVSDVRAQSSPGYLAGRMVMTPWNYPQPDFQPINLSAPEVLDWAYWGLSSNASVDRKSGGGIIGSMSVVGSDVPTQDSSCFDEFTWSNGDVNASVATACAGLMVFNSGEGFQITVPADRTAKTLKLYVGIEGATGKLEAHLSDASASAYVDTSLVTDGAAAATYVIDFQAGSPGQTLTVTYTLQDLEWGEVTLEAAVLTAKNPSVSLTQPAPGQSFTAPASFTASADASQPGGTLDSVSLFENGSPLLTLTGEPYDFQVSGLAAGNYELSAQALDSNGLSQTSDPVPIHVVGTGGELTASVTASPATVDLTQQGTADWILFGRDFNIDSDRKANVAPLIRSTSEPSVGGVSLLNWAYDYYYDDGAITYSAQDGTYQFGSATSGIYLPNPGSGFEFSVDAGLTERTVKVYVGANRGQGKLEAYLSDGSAPVYVDSSTDSQDGIDHVYSLTYHAASDGQKLIVRYTLLSNHEYGNVTLQAITLSGSPVLTPVIDSIFPPGGGVGIPINISGANFGTNQNSAMVTIDGVAANVLAWSNTSIRTAVPQISSSGSVIVTVNGFPSNPVPFQFVLAARSSSQSVNISPDEMYLEVGQERVLKLVDQRGAKVSDVTWSVDNEDIARVVPSSDPNSTDQFLEGVGEGKVTITAVSSEGTAQAQASVFLAGQTPVGSPKWAVYPDNYNNDLGLPIKGMQNSPSDPYSYLIEYYGDGSAFAIRALDQTGQQMWRKNVPGMPDVNGNPSAYPANSIGTPDGGLLVNASYPNQSTLMMVAPDGTTKWTADGSNMSNFAVGYDGTIYAIKGDPTVGQSIVVIDGPTGNSNYAITPNGTVGEGLVSDEAADAFHPCRDHINDIPPSQGIGGTFLAGPVVAANGHAYVVQTSDLYSFTYTSCNYGGGTNDAGITYYYIDSADGTLSESAQLVLRELTPTGPGDTVSIASNSYNGQAHLGRIGTGGGGGGGFSTPDGVAISNSWNVLGLAPDAEGGILVNADDGKGSRLIRALQNAFQYSVPGSGYDLAIAENGIALIQEGFDSGVAAVNVDDGTSLWSTTNGRIVSATDDDGVLLQQYNNDGTASIFEVDQSGQAVTPVVPLPGNHVQYMDQSEAVVESMYYGSITDVQVPQFLAQPSEIYPVLADGSLSRMKAAKGTKIKEFVEPGETSGCTGLDTGIKGLPAVMVPIGGISQSSSNTINFRVHNNLNVTLLPYDANKVSISPSSIQGDGNSHPIVLTGLQPGSTMIGVFGEDGQLIGKAFQVDVKPSVSYSVYTLGITESSEVLDPGAVPDSADLTAYWNQVFGRQANVYFTVQASGTIPVHYDIQEQDRKLHHVRGEPYSANLETHAIEVAIDQAFPGLRDGRNMFATFVRDIQDPTTEGFSGQVNHYIPSFVRDRSLNSSKRWVITHEIGHNVGAPHSKAQGTLMYWQDMGGDVCRIGKETWDALNPVQ